MLACRAGAGGVLAVTAGAAVVVAAFVEVSVDFVASIGG